MKQGAGGDLGPVGVGVNLTGPQVGGQLAVRSSYHALYCSIPTFYLEATRQILTEVRIPSVIRGSPKKEMKPN